MALRRRPAPTPTRKAFESCAADVVEAKRALLASVPTARMAGRPLAESLAAFDDALDRAAAAMPAWRAETLEAEWLACEEGIARARAEAERVRLESGDLAYEPLVWLVDALLAPLDAFRTAEARLAELARRGRR